jgi:hypothetical protein
LEGVASAKRERTLRSPRRVAEERRVFRALSRMLLSLLSSNFLRRWGGVMQCRQVLVVPMKTISISVKWAKGAKGDR